MESTSFVRCLWQDSDAPLQVGSWQPRGAAAMRGRGGGGGKWMKNESAPSNNCSGSIIPTLEQLVMMGVSAHQKRELLSGASLATGCYLRRRVLPHVETVRTTEPGGESGI